MFVISTFSGSNFLTFFQSTVLCLEGAAAAAFLATTLAVRHAWACLLAACTGDNMALL